MVLRSIAGDNSGRPPAGRRARLGSSAGTLKSIRRCEQSDRWPWALLHHLNFEQVSKYAAQTVGHWADKAPEARFIVTSREVLGIPGEQAIALAPMTLSEATCLFLARAAAASSDFDPGDDERSSIEALVELLDGLPLAIELAAARVRVMPPSMLVDRISERFALLSSPGGRPDLQTTLRRTLDWSWDLLPVPERTALAQLSVFEGGFSLRSAEAVVKLPHCEPAPWIVDVIQGLAEKSMLRRVSDHRFDLLSVVKEYARQRLLTEDSFPGSGSEACVAAETRHWQYFAKLDEKFAVAEKCIELGNLVAACRRASEGGDSAGDRRCVDERLGGTQVVRSFSKRGFARGRYRPCEAVHRSTKPKLTGSPGAPCLPRVMSREPANTMKGGWPQPGPRATVGARRTYCAH